MSASGHRSRATVRIMRMLLVLALATMLAAFAGPRAHAADDTLDSYTDRVARAASVVDDAVTDTSVSAEEANAVSAEVASLLPETERVTMPGGEVVTVDNTVLASLAERLATQDSHAKRVRILEDMQGHLAALSVSAGEPGEAVPQDADALDALLADQVKESRNPVSEWFAALVDRLGEFILKLWDSSEATPGGASTMRIATIVVLVGLALGLLWMLVRVVMSLRSGTARKPARPRLASDEVVVEAALGLPADALAHADELASREEWRDAVRALFGGAARSLVETGYIVETHRRTNGELLLEIRPAAPHVYEPLAALCAVFERAWYGHHDPGATGFATARDEYLRVLDRLAGQDAPTAGPGADVGGEAAQGGEQS